jgi:hypothetical protein
VLGPFSTDRPCKRKVNRPPSDAALALAAELLGGPGADPITDSTPTGVSSAGRRQGEPRRPALPAGAVASRLPKLAAAAEALPGELDQAMKAKATHTEFLGRLLAIEVDATEARRHAGRLRFANF